MACYIFRIDNGNSFLEKEIRMGRLRQGWGLSSMSLKDDEGNLVSENNWIENYGWKDTDDKYKVSKYRNLKNMLKMEKGDIVIIPKFPKWNTLTVARIKKGYYFQMPQENDIEDFGHIVDIDLESLRSFNYNANIESNLIHSKLRAYQSPINVVYVDGVIKSAEGLLNLESTEEFIKIEDIVKKNFETGLDEIRRKFENVGNRDIENIVSKIFKKQGYEIESSNRYDGKGGDADLIFTKSLSILEEVDDEKSFDTIYIQVKHKNGENFNDNEGIEQLEKIVKSDFEGQEINKNIYKVLVCTARSFHPEMIELANEKNIILINGLQLARLVIKYI